MKIINNMDNKLKISVLRACKKLMLNERMYSDRERAMKLDNAVLVVNDIISDYEQQEV